MESKISSRTRIPPFSRAAQQFGRFAGMYFEA